MTTNKPLYAKTSKLGHKGFQYPDTDGRDIVVPNETPLTQLHWIGGGGWTAWAWDGAEGVRVVWTKNGENK